MATILTAKHHGALEVFSFLGRCCVSAMKGCVYIAGGIGGCVIVLGLLLPFFLIVSFLLKLFGF